LFSQKPLQFSKVLVFTLAALMPKENALVRYIKMKLLSSLILLAVALIFKNSQRQDQVVVWRME
jgi:hypothetical protein